MLQWGVGGVAPGMCDCTITCVCGVRQEAGATTPRHHLTPAHATVCLPAPPALPSLQGEQQCEVSMEQGMRFAAAHGCLFVATSAKGNVAVDQAFEELVNKVRCAGQRGKVALGRCCVLTSGWQPLHRGGREMQAAAPPHGTPPSLPLPLLQILETPSLLAASGGGGFGLKGKQQAQQSSCCG